MLPMRGMVKAFIIHVGDTSGCLIDVKLVGKTERGYEERRLVSKVHRLVLI